MARAILVITTRLAIFLLNLPGREVKPIPDVDHLIPPASIFFIRQTLDETRSVDFREILDRKPIHRALGLASAAVLVAVLIVAAAPELSSIALRRLFLPFGPDRIGRVGIVTGAGASLIPQAAAAGLDTFVTGEGPHKTFFDAEELKINVIFGGHYATETVGVKALAEHLAAKFKLPWSFLDHPTGL